MFTDILISISGIFVFMFLFWRKLKEDYLSHQIFSSIFLILLILATFISISKFYLPVFWFWLGFLGYLLGLFICIKKFTLNTFETLEVGLISILPWLSLVFLHDAIKNTSWVSLTGFVFMIFMVFLYLYLNRKYKEFSWYKSGKTGFAGLTTIGFYFLIRGLVAIFFPFVLSFVGIYEPILSGIAALGFFSVVFYLSKL